MASHSASSASPLQHSLGDFHPQNLLKNPEEEKCSFGNQDVSRLLNSGVFPPETIIRAFDPDVRCDYASNIWVCFPEFPFTIGLRYPFPPFITRFFEITQISPAQTMPVVWRILSVLNRLVETRGLKLEISDLATVYNLRTHGSYRFVLQAIKKSQCPIQGFTKNGTAWKRRFFFVKRDSIPGGNDLPLRWVEKGRILGC
jgi:hypothetical protein